MELLLILTYAAICVAVFKIFRIPVNKWTLPTAVLGGIFMIGTILLVMNYNHPFTATARIYFATTPIMPTVKGRVIEVPVKPNTPAEGRRRFVSHRSATLPVRRRSEEGDARRGRADRQAAENELRSGLRHGRKGEGAAQAGARRVCEAATALRKEGHRPDGTRYRDPQYRRCETGLGRG